MSPIIAIAVFVMAAALILWNAAAMRRLKTDYGYDGKFQGKRYECVLRFANLESGIWCFLGADASAFYLLTTPARRWSWWDDRGVANQIFKMDLRIPWSDLDWREKRILFKDCIWFDIPAKNVHFYLAKDVGDKLLADAERKVPVAI